MNFKVFLTVVGMLVATIGYGQITINSLTPTSSDCPNNGTITVNATHSGGSSMLYSIISGPVTQPQQTSPTFSSLEPGTYTIQVSDIFNNQEVSSITVPGTYEPLEFFPTASKLSCPGVEDGTIKGNLVAGTGEPPYTWELISPSEQTAPQQPSDLFENLPKGEYTIRVNDNCSSYDTKIINVEEEIFSISIPYTPAIKFTSCNTAEIYISLESKSFTPPYTVEIESNGTPITTLDPPYFGEFAHSPNIDIRQGVNGISYGDLIKVTVTDNCGRTTSKLYTIETFENQCASSNVKQVNCQSEITVAFGRIGFGCYTPNSFSTSYASPYTYELRNNSDNTVFASGVIPKGEDSRRIEIVGVPENTEFTYTATDGCGNTEKVTYKSPSPSSNTQTPTLTSLDIEESACMDSLARVEIDVRGFNSSPILIFTDGPTEAKNTKESYEYDYSFSYPDTIIASGGGSGNRVSFGLNNMPAGTYTYIIQDNCGGKIPGTINITDNDLSDYSFKYSLKKNCSGKNEIYFETNDYGGRSFLTYPSGVREERDYPHDKQVFDTIANLAAGKYSMFYQPSDRGGRNFIESQYSTCYRLSQKFEIEDYESPRIYTYNRILCNNDIFIEIIPDSTKGIPPYEFEIISGPQTFPRQTSNVFIMSTEGVYRARIYDECGNASVTDITLENLQFEPLSTEISCSSVSIKYPVSSYYSYLWTKPDGSTFSGDSLSIASITPSDTGIYNVKQTVTISNCTGTFNDEFHILAETINEIEDSICPGDNYLFGGNLYNKEGIYADTLLLATGCDSIVNLNLKVRDYLSGTQNATICPGGNINIEGNIYSEQGSYKDTLSTLGCDSILTINIDFGNYLTGDVTKEICVDGSTIIEGKTYDTPGIYKDTISNGTCDSVLTITIEEIDYFRNTLQTELCDGDSIEFYNKMYYGPGTFKDTLITSTCDSIITIEIYSIPTPFIDLGPDQEFCQGSSVTFEADAGYAAYMWNDNPGSNSRRYQSDLIGKYWVSVEDFNGCINSDTVEVTQINPNPTVTATSSTSTICEGDSVSLTASGGTTYLWLPDSLHGQSIKVAPEKSIDYSVITFNNFNCASTPDIVQIEVNHLPEIPLFDQERIYHCFLENDLVITANWGETFLWTNTGDTTQDITVTDDGYYELTAWDKNGCPLKKEVEVLSKCESMIFVPDAFSPNYDGKNDELQVFGKNFTDFEMRVFNRWGEIIFMTDNFNTMWDGMYKGKMMPVGTYPWVIKYKSIPGTLDEGTIKQITGSITVIR